jgi:hypothetical protein
MRVQLLMSGYGSDCEISGSNTEALPFDPADATERIVHRFWVSVNGAGEGLEHHGMIGSI